MGLVISTDRKPDVDTMLSSIPKIQQWKDIIIGDILKFIKNALPDLNKLKSKVTLKKPAKKRNLLFIYSLYEVSKMISWNLNQTTTIFGLTFVRSSLKKEVLFKHYCSKISM
ncbi:hypothetical protein [uncultured Aquimarina sp.]|uniref:hypothetical protein n=1 Tax=uncultured Aquimarina sp. TaxID=575652 RepID=UPI002616D31B|nr:hypothetical protein [uncultured Aquimarina sp.]